MMENGTINDRMDRIDLEPGDGVYEDQSRVPELLRGADGEAVEGNGAAELSEWVRGNLSRARTGNTVALEDAADDLRKLHERSVS